MTAGNMKGAKRLGEARYLKEHHFLFIERPYYEVADEILKWGWSSWWPEQGCVQYYVGKDAAVETGTSCEMVLKMGLLRVRLKGGIAQIKEKRMLQIDWRSGMMVGQEFVIVEERSNGTRIDHRARYKGSNFLMKIFWVVCFRRRYQAGIRQAMDALRTRMGQ